MASSSKIAPHHWAWLLLCLLLGSSLLSGLQVRPLYKVQEVRIAETAREMLLSGDYAIPRLNGELRLQKPPLPYWWSVASYQLFGVSAWAARLPSVIATLLTALLLFEWLRRKAALPEAAINIALIVATSFLALRYGRSAEADAGLMLWISAACLSGYQLVSQAGACRWPALGLALFAGLAFLSKGPAGLAIPLLVTVGFAVLEHRQQRLLSLLNWRSLLLLLLVAGGWYGWLWWRMPELLQSFVGKQVDETFISGNHAEPAWWYLAHIWEFFLPWILLLPAALYCLYRDYLAAGKPALPRPLKFACLWLGVVLILLSLTVNKQTQYALLLAPPLAVVLGYFLALCAGNRWLRWALRMIALGLGIALCISLAKLLGPNAVSGLASAPVQTISEFPFDIPLLMLMLLFAASLKWLGLVPSLSPYVLLISILTCLLYNVGELQRSGKDDKWDARNVIVSIKQNPAWQSKPLLQLAPGDGALSFYGLAVVPVIKPQHIVPLLQDQAQGDSVLLIAEQLPPLPGTAALRLTQAGEFSVWQLSLQPASTQLEH